MKLSSNILLFFLLLFSLGGCTASESIEDLSVPQDTHLYVHFIDVGQADAALLIQGDSAMLIDGGNVADSALIVAYLEDYGVTSLDYVVCSHGHEDHVGGLAAALSYFPVGQVFSPITEYDSNAFRNFVYYTEGQGLSLTQPSVGATYSFGDSLITILGPLKEYEDANDISIVLRVDYGETSFLFTGDIEREAESDLVEAESYLSSNVLKVCHHGSSTSSTYPFLYAVNPRYAVISCELEGKYGHPNEDVLSRFRDAEVELFRTDLQGHIIAVSDGATISFSTERNRNIQTNPTENMEETVLSGAYIGNLNSMMFHIETCNSLPAEHNQIFFTSRNSAIEKGYTACSRCNP